MMQQKEDENLIKIDELVDGTVWWKGKRITGYPNNCTTPMISVIPGQSYMLYRASGSQAYVNYFDQDGAYVYQTVWDDIVYATQGVTKQIPSNVYYVGITIGMAYKDTAVFKKV